MAGRLRAGLLILAMIPGCATTSVAPTVPLPPAAPGHQVLQVGAVLWKETTADFPGRSVTSVSEPLPGVICKARNAKGSWETTTPGFLQVAIGEGAGPLRIDCELEGYRTEHAEFGCITPRSRSTASGAMAGLQLIGAAGPAAIFLAPAAVIAALAGATFAGAAVGSAVAGPDPDVCNYTDRGGVLVHMTRKPQ